jgi:hypothetical protein
MASIIKAGNATDGVQVSSDATGALDIKTGTGAGTTAISIDASQNATLAGNLTVTGNLTAGGGVVYNLEQYVAPATWTKPANLKAIKVTVVGGGGDGGTSTNSPTVGGGFAGGGGGGGAAIEFIPAPSIPGPVSVTAGAGTNSFGPFCSATAGGNGTNSTSAAPNTAGGAGGTGSGGQINISGTSGQTGNTLPSRSGTGGSSAIIYSVNMTPPGPNTAGAPNGIIGGGGTGAGSRNPGPAGTLSGGAGAPGIVIVEEFY